MSSRIVLSGITGGGGGGDGDGERAGLPGLLERGLADEAGFAEEEAGLADDGGGGAVDEEAAGAGLCCFASCDGAGDGECTRTGMEIATPEGPPRSWMLVMELLLFGIVSDERRLVVAEVTV